MRIFFFCKRLFWLLYHIWLIQHWLPPPLTRKWPRGACRMLATERCWSSASILSHLSNQSRRKSPKSCWDHSPYRLQSPIRPISVVLGFIEAISQTNLSWRSPVFGEKCLLPWHRTYRFYKESYLKHAALIMTQVHIQNILYHAAHTCASKCNVVILHHRHGVTTRTCQCMYILEFFLWSSSWANVRPSIVHKSGRTGKVIHPSWIPDGPSHFSSPLCPLLA